MPYTQLQTSTGPVEIHYRICTPSDACAPSIDKNLPTVLFLHPSYLGSIAFHNQLNDPSVRRFNCVSYDARYHGRTVDAPVDKNYGPAQAAEDVVLLLDALDIQKVHLFGVQTGTFIAMHMAMKYPERCLSAHLLSPLAIREPEDVQAGRAEIADCWEQGFGDTEARGDAIYGTLQLAFSNELDGLIHAMVRAELPYAVQRFSPENIGAYRIMFLGFFETDREQYCREGFSRVKCPVQLTYCTEDIAYTLEQSEELLALMRDSGMDVTLLQVPGCHYGNVKLPEAARVNELLVDFVQKVDPTTASLSIPVVAASPFDEVLEEAGWVPGESDDP